MYHGVLLRHSMKDLSLHACAIEFAVVTVSL
jgi:hypothetical protein